MAKLTIKDESGSERVHELVDATTLVGRASTNTVQVKDEKASRQHFKIEKDGERFKVIDLGSTNGIRLNGARLKDSALLCNGDIISLGKTTFKYEGPGDARPAEPAVAAAPAPAENKPATIKLDSSSDAPKYVLRMLEGASVGKIFELGSTALTLGRHASNTISINDDAASNYHAEVTREPMGFVLTDLGSTNGTRVKAKGKSDFEKVIKTPLVAGAQIRIGKTVLEFENIGKPEEDQLFSTIALDPDKLGDKLEEPSRGGAGKYIGIASIVIVVVGLGFVIASSMGTDENSGKGSGKSGKEVVVTPPTPADLSNRIANGDFSEGTDDEGNPKQFKIERGAPGVKVAVVAEADRGSGGDKKMGLQIAKSGKSGAALTSVETGTTFAVEPGRAYELGGWMKNDGDGLFGLRVTWLAGERKLTEHPVVLKDTQEWKEKGATVTPPAWAQRARAGVFALGKDGKASFDDIAFREKPDAPATAAPNVKFGSVTLQFEGSKGFFTGLLQGETVIEEGTLLLRGTDGQIIDLTSSVDPRTKAEGQSATVDGRIYDFALQELTNYRLEALPGGNGVDLRAAVDTPSEHGCKPELRFYVTGAVAQGDVEVTKGGAVQRIAASDASASVDGVDEILFNAGKTQQLNLTFGKPASVELRREGNRRAVTIHFKGELQLSFSPESQAQKKQMLALVEGLQASVNVKRWGDAEAKLLQLQQQYKARYPQASEEASKAEAAIERAWKAAQEEVQRAMDNVKQLKTISSGNLAKDTITRHVNEWSGSSRVNQISDNMKLIAEFLKEGDSEKAEKDAETFYANAEQYYNKKAYTVAISILKARILNDKVMKETAAGKKAQALIEKAEAAERRQRELQFVEEKLREKVKNYLLTGDYKSAIDTVEKDKDFQDNRTELTQINALLDDWKKKSK